ncbi:MAG: NAD kinase [Flavobacteriales bacterium]|jgi:NAD+ kinase|uniref:NAD kinase n=1 Tax=Blattabacterium sp. (Mastotermes darwiniensis) TaxID=39768 RepID=UPI000231DEF7|nr:NAD kinase [Blattabacterium sp. (Mastotermes darwiniensis)]AER40811.1 inorganic polyphosphate/ATP-NAD kinase [Blattabacterium sp. (Mastotermes darwiniensis) str. MADAR]MDR1804658.1 NAD kinase [Flavobacteriales bacterium]
MKVALYGQKFGRKNIPYLNQFIGYVSNHSIEIYIEKSFFHVLSSFEEFKNLNFPVFSHYKELTKDFSLMFTFGGDGTILSAITFVRDTGIPIVGVNTGNLGFLATFNKDVFIKKIDQIFNRKFHLMPRSLLCLETSIMDHDPFFNFALNEIVIIRKETVSMIIIDAYIDNQFLTSYWADGLIISTPTGSTGYSLSCGGPIITPENKNFVLTPISPHNLFSRPLIISDHQKIHLKIHSRVKYYSLSMDTRLTSLKKENELYIKKAPFYIYLIQEEKHTYYKTLREKLLWGMDQRN